MERLGWLLLAIAVAYGLALAVPLLARRRRLPNWAGWCFTVAALACPLLIPADFVGFRAASAFVSTDLAFKMVDFLRQHGRTWDAVVTREYFRFLVPFPVFAIVHPNHKRRLPRPDRPWRHIPRILAGSVVVAAGAVLARTLAALPAVVASPALDHL